MTRDVLTLADNGVGRIRLNRSKAIYALNTGMCQPINAALAQRLADDAVACRIVMLPDLREGARALLIDKDNAPRWNPPTPEQMTQDMLDAIFAPLPPDQQWSPK